MSRKRRGESSAPALFPFLAVLLCTIGALVLILVLTVANSHASAKRDVESEISEIAEATNEMEIVSAELDAQRNDLKARVERRRRDLADIEDHITRLSETLDQLLSKIERVQSESTLTDEERSDKTGQIAKLKTEIDAKKRELVDEIEKQKKRKPAFAVIPYSGSNGTNRRPVYLECTKDGVIVQPEGLLISLQDLRPPFGPGNPLDAALRVLRLAYQQKDATFGVTLPPYPLLIVRPDGIQTYALAREAMSGWDDQFGYELVENEMELKFPVSPPGLKEQLTSTVELAKRRQQALIAAMPRRVSAPDGEDSWDGIDASNAGPTGAGTGNGQAQGGASGFASGDNSSQQEWKLVQGVANSQISGAIQRNGMASQSAGQPDGGSGASAAGLPPSAANPNSFSSSGSTLSGQYVVTNNTNGSGPFGSNAGTQSAGGPGSEMANNGKGKTGTSEAGASNSGQEVANNGSNGAVNGGGAANGTNAGAATNANGSAGANGANSNGSGAGSNSTASASGPSNGSGSSSSPAPPGANAFSSGTATGGASGMASAGGPSQGQSDPNASPNLSLSVNQKPESAPAKAKHVRAEGDVKPISVSAGHGWAASRAEGKATPVSRPINIVALKDRWLLRSDLDPNTFEANLTMEEGPQKAGDQLALAMRKRVDSWGIAVVGGYWSPSLTIEAASDAQQSVARLERLLEGSGVEIKVVPLTLPKRR